MNPKNKNTKSTPKKETVFNAQEFLDSAGVERTIKEFKRAELVYSHRRVSQERDVLARRRKLFMALSVVSEAGKEAVVAILGPGDFFGEGCMAGQPVRMGTATAVGPSTVLVVDKAAMFKVLHEQHDLSDRFIGFMLARNIRIEEDLVDQHPGARRGSRLAALFY